MKRKKNGLLENYYLTKNYLLNTKEDNNGVGKEKERCKSYVKQVDKLQK